MVGNSRTSLVLGITGGLACGKSEVGRILEKLGFSVCDADQVAHDLMKKGTPVYRRLVDHFGVHVLLADGEISRQVLGEIIFKNPTEREALNELVHPAVREALKNWVSESRKQGKSSAVLIPLLFESGMDDLDWDAILCVSSSEKQVFQRLLNRGLEGAAADLRIKSQWPLEEKEARADGVIQNLGTLAELECFTRDTVKRVRAERELYEQ